MHNDIYKIFIYNLFFQSHMKFRRCYFLFKLKYSIHLRVCDLFTSATSDGCLINFKSKLYLPESFLPTFLTKYNKINCKTKYSSSFQDLPNTKKAQNNDQHLKAIT